MHCTLCHKNLTDAARVVGAPLTRALHVTAHRNDALDAAMEGEALARGMRTPDGARLWRLFRDIRQGLTAAEAMHE